MTAERADPKLLLFGWPDAAHLKAAGLDGWYLVEGGSPWHRTVMSITRGQPVVASGVPTTDAQEIVAAHNRDLLALAPP